MSAPTTPPGWYPDINQQNVERFWDGNGWTPAVRDVPSSSDRDGGTRTSGATTSYWSSAGAHSGNQHLVAPRSIPPPLSGRPQQVPTRSQSADAEGGLFPWVMWTGIICFVASIIAASEHLNTLATILFLPSLFWVLYAAHLNGRWRINSNLICPHCQQRGQVVLRSITRKRGISGGKATGAVLTGGLSLFATGLSRKEGATQCRCGNCRVIWYV